MPKWMIFLTLPTRVRECAFPTRKRKKFAAPNSPCRLSFRLCFGFLPSARVRTFPLPVFVFLALANPNKPFLPSFPASPPFLRYFWCSRRSSLVELLLVCALSFFPFPSLLRFSRTLWIRGSKLRSVSLRLYFGAGLARCDGALKLFFRGILLCR